MSFIVENNLSGLVHLRMINPDIGVDDLGIDNRGGLSIVYRIKTKVDDEGVIIRDPKTTHLEIGYSVCSYADNFNRKTGRELALARLNAREKFFLGTSMENILITDTSAKVFFDALETMGPLDDGYYTCQSHENVASFNEFFVYHFVPKVFFPYKDVKIFRLSKCYVFTYAQ